MGAKETYWFPSQTRRWMRWRESRWKLRWTRRMKRCRRPTVEYVAHTHGLGDTNIHTKHTLRTGTQTWSSPNHNNEFCLIRKNYTALRQRAACIQRSDEIYHFDIYTKSDATTTFSATFWIFPSHSAQKQSALVCLRISWLADAVFSGSICSNKWREMVLTTAVAVWCSALRSLDQSNDHFHTFPRFLGFYLFSFV